MNGREVLSQASAVADRVMAVPGVKPGAAFFSFLRANLVQLPASNVSSSASTPLLYPSPSHSLPTFIPSSLATMTSAHADEDGGDLDLDLDLDEPPPPLAVPPLDAAALDASLPPLTTQALTAAPDRVAALKLIADSIAQQRQFAAASVLFHPATIAAYLLALAIAAQLLYRSSADLPLVVTTCAGITMALLVGVRAWTGDYITQAETFGAGFLEGEQDVVIGSRYGEAIIGALVLRIERNGGGGHGGNGHGHHGHGRKRSKGKNVGGKGLVRAWTTRLKYRGAGVGTEMLEEAVRLTRERLGNAAEIGFAVEHANSRMVLPEMFNRGFRKREIRAARTLEAVVDRAPGGGKRKR